MRRLIALGSAVLVLVLLAVAQLVLPGIAAQQLRDRLARSGTVLHVEVHAFPAIELLWHQADRVVIRMGSYRSSSPQLGVTLGQTGDVGTLDASATEVRTGLLTVHDATLKKRGNQLTGSARITEADLRSSVPFLQGVQPIASGGGQLVLRGTATLLGVSATVDATVAAQNGELIAQPDVPFGALATVTLFNDPHIAVRGVSVTGVSSGQFTVGAQGTLR
ncbi:MAG: LmeA family phospholipid-binding protein [Solirubrobacteraceae bacterium]